MAPLPLTILRDGRGERAKEAGWKPDACIDDECIPCIDDECTPCMDDEWMMPWGMACKDDERAMEAPKADGWAGGC